MTEISLLVEPADRLRSRRRWLTWLLLALVPLAVIDLFAYGLGTQLAGESCAGWTRMEQLNADAVIQCPWAEQVNIQFGTILGLTALCFAGACLFFDKRSLRLALTAATLVTAASPVLLALLGIAAPYGGYGP